MTKKTLLQISAVGGAALLLSACASIYSNELQGEKAPDAAATTPPTNAATAPTADNGLPKPKTNPLPDPLPPMALAEAKEDFVKRTSAKFGIDPNSIRTVLNQATKLDSVIALMSKPAETSKTWAQYRPIFITDARISGGRKFIAENRADLEKVESVYGVPKEIIVAIMGVETGWGANMGKTNVVNALYTLGFFYPRSGDPTKADREARREAFFRNELMELFAMGKRERMDITTLQGSYAGAMGYGQFMPSSYMELAVDGDGDGRADLFRSKKDAFASIANYFVRRGGWVRGGTVTLKATKDAAAADLTPESLDPIYTVQQLADKGFRPMIPVTASAKANVFRLDGVSGPEYWYSFQNFYAITRYNISKHYGMAVYDLARELSK